MTDPRAPADDNTKSGRQNQRRARNAALIYALLAALWILLSDLALDRWLDDPRQLALASAFKGWLFVAVTALLLYTFLRREPGPVEGVSLSTMPRQSWRIQAALALVVLAFTGGAIAYTYQQHRAREAVRLEAIADVKSRQVADWLAERLRDARHIQTSQALAEDYQRWQRNGDTTGREALTQRLRSYLEDESFQAIMLLDGKGATLWQGGSLDGNLAPAVREQYLSLGRQDIASWVGPYRDARGKVHLDFVAPLPVAGPRPVVVLHSDQADFLVRHLRDWPVPSASGEALLFRRDGDQVLFLNELRHKGDTAAKLRLPLASSQLLAAQVLRGDAPLGRVFDGRDYRGVPVLGVGRAVPGTDWYMVVKIDRAEVHAAAAGQAVWIAMVGLLTLFAALVGHHMLRQRQQLRLARAVQASQGERLRALRLLAAIAENSADAIFAKDMAGRYILFNPRAEHMVGKSSAEVLNRDDTTLLSPEDAARVMETDRQVLKDGRTVLKEYELTLPAGRRNVQVTEGPLLDEAWAIIGLYGIARDITDRAREEQALRDSETRLQLALRAANQGLFDLDISTGEAVVSPEYARMLGYEPEAFHETNVAWIERLHPEDRERVTRTYRDYLAGETPDYRVEFRQRTAAGNWIWILSLGRVVERDDAGNPLRMIGTHTDITEHKQAEAALRDSERRFRTLFEQAPMGIDMVSPDGVPLRANRALERLLGYAEAEMLQHHFNDWTHPEDREASLALVRRLRAGEADSLSMEKRYVRKDGGVVSAQTHVAAVRDPAGVVEYFVVVVEDLTRRKQDEDELRQRNAELEAFNLAAVGRELTMIELKRRINELSARLGEAPPYDLAVLDAPPSAGPSS